MAVLSLPIHEALPVELIIQIAKILIQDAGGLWDVVNLAKTDRIMREIIVSCPTFWNSMQIDHKPSSSIMAKVFIERSKSEPLTIILGLLDFGIGFPQPHKAEIMQVLGMAAPRLKTLIALMNTAELLGPLRITLPPLHMPKLETLHFEYITVRVSFHGQNDHNRTLALPNAPQLKLLVLTGLVTSPLQNTRSYTNLTSIRFGAGLRFIPSTGVMTQIVKNATALEELHFDGEATMVTTSDWEWTNKLRCPNVRYLTILNADAPFVVQALTHLEAPLLETLMLSEPCQSNHHPQVIRWDAIQATTHTSVRNLIIYPWEGSWDNEFPDEGVLLLLMQSFPEITSLTLPTSGTRILANWAKYPRGNYWKHLEHLKVYYNGDWGDEAVRDVYNFIVNRQKRSCAPMRDIELDTQGVRDARLMRMASDYLKGAVEKVGFGAVARPPPKWMP